jgi:hypothetical protein
MKNLLYIALFIWIQFKFSLKSLMSECAKEQNCNYAKRNHQNLNHPSSWCNIGVTYYKLDLSVSYTLKNIKGEVTINAK